MLSTFFFNIFEEYGKINRMELKEEVFLDKFQKFCCNSLKLFIGIALFLIFICSLGVFGAQVKTNLELSIFLLLGVSLVTGVFIINSQLSTKIKVVLLLTLSFLIRIWWILNIDSVPVSDYETMYLSAKELLNGDYSAFRGFKYLARFPHLVCSTLYMALMILIFPISHLFAIKIANVILSIISLILLYKLSDYFLKHEKVKLAVILLGGIYPAFISYSSTYCTENIAIPLFLGVMLLFMRACKSNDIGKWLLCGIVLAISDLFRAVGIVFLIAFVIYIFVFTQESKFRNSLILIASMLFTTFSVSLFLISTGIIEKPLWQGAEPSFATLMLKGSNATSYGKWNLEDAQFVEENLENKDLGKMCIEKSIDRIRQLSSLERIEFFATKFLSQWSIGDFCGTYWATLETENEIVGTVPRNFQIAFSVIIFLSILSIFAKNTPTSTTIMYILLCGFGLVFMILETQQRYSYICSWIFVILATQGIENIINWRVKNVKFFRRNNKRT